MNAAHGVPVSLAALSAARKALVVRGKVGPSRARKRVARPEEIAAVVRTARETGDELMASLVLFLSVMPLRLSEALALDGGRLAPETRSLLLNRKSPILAQRQEVQVVPCLTIGGWTAGPSSAGRVAEAEGGRAWPVRATTASMRMARLTRAAGIEGLTIHTLRSYAAGVLMANGVNQGIVMQITGHRTTRVLDLHYTKHDPETLRRAAERT